MTNGNVLSWITSYQLKTIVIGLAIVALCIGGYLLMDKNKKENDGFVIMRRNAKGQFQKAMKDAEVTLEEDRIKEPKEEIRSSREFIEPKPFIQDEVHPETVIKRNVPQPEREIRREQNVNYNARPEYGRPLVKDVQDQQPVRNSGITNGDRVRAMSDEELAEFLTNVESGGFIKLWLKQKQNKDNNIL